MVYTDRMNLVFQKKTLDYFFLNTNKSLYKAVIPINLIDGTFFAIGPTILVEWEE